MFRISAHHAFPQNATLVSQKSCRIQPDEDFEINKVVLILCAHRSEAETNGWLVNQCEKT